jgi:hypothetical protein
MRVSRAKPSITFGCALVIACAKNTAGEGTETSTAGASSGSMTGAPGSTSASDGTTGPGTSTMASTTTGPEPTSNGWMSEPCTFVDCEDAMP